MRLQFLSAGRMENFFIAISFCAAVVVHFKVPSMGQIDLLEN